ncbi:HHE domain-containing protein [Mycena galericulata]|nr:HHE domain-containing protein [Mycena galericulata]
MFSRVLLTTSRTASHSARPFLTLTRTMASKQRLTDAIKEDHQEMYEYHDYYKKSAGDPDAQTRWARQLTWEIARHAVGEEIVVYPLMEKHLGEEGLKLADHDREEHQHVKEILSHLESLTPGTNEYDKLIEKMMVSLHHHNDDEEVKDLPLLEPYLGEKASESAASQFSLTKKFVPTRAHPDAPNKPPFETLAGFLVAPIDKLKDAFSKFPTQEMKDSVKS